MKKILKCLCLLFIIPIVSVFTLTGCKDKNKNTPQTISYSNLKTILNSAFTQLYGTETPAIPPEITVSNSNPSDVVISQNTNLFNTIASDSESFKSSTGSSVLAINNMQLNLKSIFKIPLTVARSLIYQNQTNVLNKTMIYSFEERESYPNQLTCKIKITVHKESVFIEYYSTSYDLEHESFFINIAFDNNFNATKIMYCLGNGDGAEDSTPENPTEYFCYAIYDLANDTSYTLDKNAENFETYKTQLKTSISNFKQSEGTVDNSVDFKSIFDLAF